LRENGIVTTDFPDDLKIAQKAIRLSRNYLPSQTANGPSKIRDHYISIFQKRIDQGFERSSREKATLATDSTSDFNFRT